MLLKVRPQLEIVAHKNRSTSKTEKTVRAPMTILPVINITMRKIAKMEQALEMIVSYTILTNISSVSISVE